MSFKLVGGEGLGGQQAWSKKKTDAHEKQNEERCHEQKCVWNLQLMPHDQPEEEFLMEKPTHGKKSELLGKDGL